MENLISKNVQNMRTIMCAISRLAPKSVLVFSLILKVLKLLDNFDGVESGRGNDLRSLEIVRFSCRGTFYYSG